MILKCRTLFPLYGLSTSLIKKMSVFVQKHNPLTGANDWIVQEENYDYHQEVSRSSFADMLHDSERNKMYEEALKKAIEIMHLRGNKANVLDIGTGTGLLSMMAVRHGADTVTACEAFAPMSECAMKIIETNGLKDRIKIISKRSTDLTVGVDGDLPVKCNILVTEVFDTELIGEGALSTFNHAHLNLLEKDCIVVPQSATVFAQIIESPLVQNWNRVKDIYNNDGKLLVQVPQQIKKCTGSAAVHDLQLNQIDLDFVQFLTDPIPVFQFDWSGQTPFIYERSTINSIKPKREGVAQAVFMWWDLQMDLEKKVVLSCAPYWSHPLSNGNKHIKLPWRDHWMQAIYYLPQELNATKEMEINLISCHDEYSIWFNVKGDLRITDTEYLKPICQCGLHMSFARTRIGQINDSKRNKKFLSILENHVNNETVVLVLSDGFYLSLCASRLGAKKVYYVETNYLSQKILNDFIKHNDLGNVTVFENLETLLNSDHLLKVNMVIGEPYFLNSILPWDNLLFSYLLKGVKTILTDDVKLFPKAGVIKCLAVKFSDLNKIRLPLGQCEGFIMKNFDDLIENSSAISDDDVEAQPLWEYPCTSTSKVCTILKITLDDIPEKTLDIPGTLDIETSDKLCNGIALWVDWLHDDENTNVISSGPVTEPNIGQIVEWDKYTRQGVYLFPDKMTSDIHFNFHFDFNEGNISFKLK